MQRTFTIVAVERNSGLSVRLGISQYFVADHLRAAQLMADLCQRRHDEVAKSGASWIDYQMRSVRSLSA
jgi:hypothetical protein